MPAPTGFSVVF